MIIETSLYDILIGNCQSPLLNSDFNHAIGKPFQHSSEIPFPFYWTVSHNEYLPAFKVDKVLWFCQRPVKTWRGNLHVIRSPHIHPCVQDVSKLLAHIGAIT